MNLNTNTVTIGDLKVNKPGYGTMRLTGKGFIGEPEDRSKALEVLKVALDNGVNYFDTADFYGDGVTNRLIKDALYPYTSQVVIGTKIGAYTTKEKAFQLLQDVNQLRKSVENNLKQLGLEQLQLVHYRHMHNGPIDFEEGIELLFEMQKEGKVKHVGLSNVTVEHIKTALNKGNIATVQNLYGYHQRTTLDSPMGRSFGGEVLDICERNGIVFIPYFSLHTAAGKEENKMEKMAKKYGLTIPQMNIAWLANKSDVILPIPGTTSVKHLDENIAAAKVKIEKEDMDYLE